MTVGSTPDRPHSAESFGDERDHGWNDDFLDLLARCLRLGDIHRIADIGCGVGQVPSRCCIFAPPVPSVMHRTPAPDDSAAIAG